MKTLDLENYNMKNKTPEEFAEELINMFKPYVHGYVGSSMLSNYEYPEQIESQAKECAILCLRKIYDFGLLNGLREPLTYLNAVETEIKNN
jgi:hypothetical protein